ncbi:MAG: hypothetical protein WCA46_30150 [Actinocatenispora sp.]
MASAAVVAGGMLLLGTGTANAGTPVPGSDQPATRPASPRGNAQPIIAPRHSLRKQKLAKLVGPLDLPRSVFNESAAAPEDLPGVTPGETPGNGGRLDVPSLTRTAQNATQPVTRLAPSAAKPLTDLTNPGGESAEDTVPGVLPILGSLTGPVSGLGGGGLPVGSEAAVLPLPLSAPSQVLPLGGLTGPEADGLPSVGQGNVLPTADLLQQVDIQAVFDQLMADQDDAPRMNTLPAPAKKTAPGSEDGSLIDDVTGGAGLPVGDLTGPVTDRLGESQEDGSLVGNVTDGVNVAELPVRDLTGPVTNRLGESQEDGPQAPQGVDGIDGLNGLAGLGQPNGAPGQSGQPGNSGQPTAAAPTMPGMPGMPSADKPGATKSGADKPGVKKSGTRKSGTHRLRSTKPVAQPGGTQPGTAPAQQPGSQPGQAPAAQPAGSPLNAMGGLLGLLGR